MDAGRVAHHQIDHLSLSQSGQRVPLRKLQAIHELPLPTDDVVDRAAGNWARLRRADPEVPVGVGAYRAVRERWSIVREVGRAHHAGLAKRGWRWCVTATHRD